MPFARKVADMAYRRLPTLAALLAAWAAASGCGGASGTGGGAHGTPSTGRAALAGSGYTAAQLEQALLTEAPGYRRAGEPDSGEYRALKAVQNADLLRRQTRLDKPRCAGAAAPATEVGGDVPTALTTFTGEGGEIVTETLMGLGGAAAERQLSVRVPASCRTFRTRIGGTWSEHRVVESPRGDLGEGSRTVGVTTVTGGARTRTWYVVVKGGRYLATISLFGPKATKAEAERLAVQALTQATRILP